MFGYVYLAREVHCGHTSWKVRALNLRLQATSDHLYALKIIPMSRDDWLETWGPRLRLLPMLQHPNVLRYFPSEWHQRGGRNRKSVSYSAAYLVMEYCAMGRWFPIVHERFLRLPCDVYRLTPMSPQRQRYSPEPERPHGGAHSEALLVAGAGPCPVIAEACSRASPPPPPQAQ